MNNKGFTLIEFIIVLFIIGATAGIYQIGINSEKYARAVFIDDSYNKGLTSGLRRGIILGGKAKFYDDLLEKSNKDKYIEGFFEGYGKGIAEGVQMGVEKCQS